MVRILEVGGKNYYICIWSQQSGHRKKIVLEVSSNTGVLIGNGKGCMVRFGVQQLFKLSIALFRFNLYTWKKT